MNKLCFHYNTEPVGTDDPHYMCVDCNKRFMHYPHPPNIYPRPALTDTQYAVVMNDAKVLLTSVGWTQGELARNSKGTKVEPNDPTAVCYCVEGAITKTIYDRFKAQPDFRIINKKTGLHHSCTSMFEYNDIVAHSVDDVTNLLDEAIADLLKRNDY